MSDPHPPRKTFHHIGLPTAEPQPNETYDAGDRCWVTNPNRHPQHVEYLRYAPDSSVSQEFQESPHVAFEVENLEPHLAGKEIQSPPAELGDPPFATAAITREHGLFVEYLKFKPGRAWFDQ